jgi:hypothetical protein
VRPDRLTRVASFLTGTSGQDAVDGLLRACVEMLPITAAGIAVVADGRHLGNLSVAGPDASAVDELQFSLGEGPCISADREARPVLEPDLAEAVGLWPAFAPAAIDLGVSAAFAFPLRVGAVKLGVLTLYRSRSGDLSRTDLADAVTLSHVASHLLLELEAGVTYGLLPERLADVTERRAIVHQATGMIAAQLESDVATALGRLRAHAWSHDLAIGDVAGDVVGRRLRFETP